MTGLIADYTVAGQQTRRSRKPQQTITGHSNRISGKGYIPRAVNIMLN